jgi:hypothetical protein
VTLSPGELDVPASQLKAFEVYGPPAGVETSEEVCVQPLVSPESGEVALEAGPERASETAFESVNEPTSLPRYQTVLPLRSALPLVVSREMLFSGSTVSILTSWVCTAEAFPAVSVA